MVVHMISVHQQGEVMSRRNPPKPPATIDLKDIPWANHQQYVWDKLKEIRGNVGATWRRLEYSVTNLQYVLTATNYDGQIVTVKLPKASTKDQAIKAAAVVGETFCIEFCERVIIGQGLNKGITTFTAPRK